MNFNFVPMELNYAEQMKSWTYDGPMKSIYLDPYYKSLEEKSIMRGPGNCIGYAALSDQGLVGLFEYYFTDEIMEIGLALHPEMVGKGIGKEFVDYGINFGIQEFTYRKEYIKLNVSTDNKPAIRVYEKVGFEEHKKENNDIEMRIYLFKHFIED